MSNIFTRKALNEIMGNDGLTPEQRTEQVFALYGRALDDGYIAKTAAQQAQQTALDNAKADWEKGIKVPDPKESDAYKQLEAEFKGYKDEQEAIASKDYEQVKPKFRHTVYGMVDRKDGAKPVEEQLKGIRESYEEYFEAEQSQPGGNGARNTPQYSRQPGHPGVNPTSKEDELYKQLSDGWK